MTYVRTDDGIYKVLWQDSVDVLSVKDENTPIMGARQIHRLSIIKQSDNVEELCDMFILKATRENGISEYQVLRNDKLLRIYKIAYEECGIPAEMHGAIWIIGERGEPILKPFAKMDKEGGWELL